MDFELDLSSENMTSFLELEQEIKEATTNLPEQLLRPSVIVKPRPKPAEQPSRTRTRNSSRSWRNSSSRPRAPPRLLMSANSRE